ncbi:LysR family transcriptional regulator [Aureimonas leprariae]|uniref:LysR family transcriptional regulator n=1 Tax=Plantimonas leprariae TaxID=2615207 RepID=A0A7V7PKL3_9HYPH|nr:LysR family transcriptional regulator [Aureimonas leprariae]KAB0676302.1 LysR family transcriptional regulator [Aureimonas leprariae]
MDDLDLNLLPALDALLDEGSVARAAVRLRLSPSAMSRTLSRLRAATGDPLLVRAGRGLVPTPRAIELRERVGPLVREAEGVLRPAVALDLAKLERAFTLRVSDGFVDNFGPALLAHVAADAPGVLLRFVQKLDRDTAGLRDGSVDLETGVVSRETGPEVRARALFHDRFVGVVREGHALTDGSITAARYAAERHILGPRGTSDRGPVDAALAGLGLERRIATVVTGFASALALVRGSDLVAAVPERHTDSMRSGLFAFPLPFDVPEVTVSMHWHPRNDADPAHHWLRECLRDACHEKRDGPRRAS